MYTGQRVVFRVFAVRLVIYGICVVIKKKGSYDPFSYTC